MELIQQIVFFFFCMNKMSRLRLNRLRQLTEEGCDAASRDVEQRREKMLRSSEENMNHDMEDAQTFEMLKGLYFSKNLAESWNHLVMRN